MLSELAAHTVWTCESGPSTRIVSCTGGQLWITCEGDARDYCLRKGDRRNFTGYGKLAIMALTDATFTLELEPRRCRSVSNLLNGLLPGRRINQVLQD